MRNLKFASLVLLLGGGLAVACNGSGDDDADGGTDSGLDSGSGGTGTGGNTGSGGGDTGVPAGCLAVEKASGSPGIISDFNGLSDPAILIDNDGRAGEFTHGHFLAKTGGAYLDFPLEPGGGEGGGPAYLHFRCEADNEDDPQCNTAWDEAAPWEQYAALETLLQLWSADGFNCYNVEGVYEGIRFKARSATGTDKIRIQVGTPDADVDKGETYQSEAIALTNAWETYQVPFSAIKQPSWSTVPVKNLNLTKLTSLSFAVRTVEPQMVDKGEKLLPYDISLDDIEFY